MPRVSSHPTSDAILYYNVDATWSTVRGDSDTAADAISLTGTNGDIGPTHTTGRGGGYTNNRALYIFSLSNIPPGARITSVKFFLDAEISSANRFVPVRSTNTNTLHPTDYGSVCIPMSYPVAMTEYASASAISTSGTTFTLNSTAISDVQSNIGADVFTIGLIGERDFENTTPANSTSYQVSIYFSEQSGTSEDPLLTIDYEDNAPFFGANF